MGFFKLIVVCITQSTGLKAYAETFDASLDVLIDGRVDSARSSDSGS
eukprot:CAMPEP_0183718210 /NCGR_PEP_ID=MMETSP0737-20130205/11532_1 /TAXON_ID=385413 /ORGANISM="Thalassiosira miniscula, Strain CCMP1093" /LENGTH=46 /DNA_ID= /DNA_START= /DNA_END= /DNA_ORIENTATION=